MPTIKRIEIRTFAYTVEGLSIDAFSQECINKTLAELQGEQDGVKHLL